MIGNRRIYWCLRTNIADGINLLFVAVRDSAKKVVIMATSIVEWIGVMFPVPNGISAMKRAFNYSGQQQGTSERLKTIFPNRFKNL